MSYLRGEEILPKELLEAVQQYVNGQSVYIPAKEKSDRGSGTAGNSYAWCKETAKKNHRECIFTNKSRFEYRKMLQPVGEYAPTAGFLFGKRGGMRIRCSTEN